MNRLLQLTIFCLLAITFQNCEGPENPEFQSMQNVRFKTVQVDDGFGVTLSGDAVLHNPNSVGVKIDNMDFDVYADGKKMTRIRQELSASMKANQDFNLPLEFDIPLKAVVDQIKQPNNLLELAKKMEIPIRVDGHIGVSIAGKTLKIPVGYEEPYQISLRTLLGK
ncbi:MAG: LEA type 2 family protein [Bacteroidota bacterium]